MELRVLGCSGGEAEGERLTSLLVDGRVAIDAGSLTQALSVEEQLRIRHLFLTHSHIDHVGTLPFFSKNVYGRAEGPVVVHGLPETLDALRRHLFNDELWPDFSMLPSPERPTIRFEELGPGRPCEVEGLRVTPIAVNHLVPTVGYLVEDDGAAFLFTSDTAATDAVYKAANACAHLRLFITEASFPNAQAWLAEQSRHLTPALAARELKKLVRNVPVALCHLSPGDRARLLPEIEAMGDARVSLLRQDARFRW